MSVQALNQDSFSFDGLCRLMREWTGILVDSGEQASVLMACRLAPLMQELGVASYRDYHQLLRASPEGSSAREAFVNALSIHTTSFFRHSYQFKYLRQAYLDHSRHSSAPFRAWSAAASVGAEAYSMAMTLEQARPSGYRILATDIAPEVLERGQSGVYLDRECEGLSPSLRKLFGRSVRYGANQPAWEVSDSLRQRILWARLNLTRSEIGQVRAVDAIFCRNVLIYFDAPTIQQVLEGIYSSLKAGGLLVLGPSEGGLLQSSIWESRFTRLDGAVFRKNELC
jgi:chemotaxis protein methyltransferase CheR